MTEVMKRRNLVIMIGIVFLLATVGVIAGTYFLSPSGYISLDVNPGIEIQTNHLNQVVSVDPVNEDAEQLMAGYVLESNNLENVLKDIVDRMILSEYLSPDKDNQILISSDGKNASAELSENLNDIISTYLAEKQLNANLIQQSITVTDENIQNAHNNNVSFGKMALIDQLMKSDAGFTFEDLSGKRISDLMTLAESKNISLAGLKNQEDVSDDDNQGDEDLNDEDEDIYDDQDGVIAIDDEGLYDGKKDINKVDDEDLNDDQEDINDIDDEDLYDDQEDINKVDDEDIDDDREDINKVGDKDLDDEKEDISDTDHE